MGNRKVQLATFSSSDFDKGAGFLKITLWYFVNALTVRASWNPFKGIKFFFLRLLGAKIGKGLVIKNYLSKKFLGNYKMRQKEVISEKERFDRLLNGIPEEEYPSDLLDEYILKAVQTKFADVKIKSSTMLMSTDLRELQRYRNICCNPTSIIIVPDLSAIPEQILYSLNRLKIITIPIQIYEDCTIGGNLLTTLPLLFLFHLMIISTTLLR